MGFNNEMHFGNFSSSEIVALTKKGKDSPFGKPFYTYTEEKNMERRLGRVLKKDFTSTDMLWGHLMEWWGFSLLGTEYSLISDKTVRHPIIDCWVGSPDAINNNPPKAVGDLKGLQLKAFCRIMDAWNKGGIEAVRDSGDDAEGYYWQIVSNACLTACSWGELILVMPYKSQIEELKAFISQYDKVGRFSKFNFMNDDELPYLPDGGHYKNINVLRFEIPFLDKQFLHGRVVEAQKQLIPFQNLVTV